MVHKFLDSVFLDRMLAKESDGLTKTVHDYLDKNYPPEVTGWVDLANWHQADVPLHHIDMSRRPGGRNMDKVKGIAKALQAGEKMEPVVLVQTAPKEYAVADGYHRTLAYQHAGRYSVPAYVGSGVGDAGPWDEEMHKRKLNVAPGEKADATDSRAQSTPIGDPPYTRANPNVPDERYPTAHVVLNPGNKRLRVRVANTPALRKTGLQNTAAPSPEDGWDGMLFEWPGIDHQATLHNAGVDYPVGAAFFDSKGMLVDALHMLPNDGTPKRAAAPHRHALELHSRDFDSLGIGPGTQMSIETDKDQSRNDTIDPGSVLRPDLR